MLDKVFTPLLPALATGMAAASAALDQGAVMPAVPAGKAAAKYVVAPLREAVTGKQSTERTVWNANHVDEGVRRWRLQQEAEAEEVVQERRRRGEK